MGSSARGPEDPGHGVTSGSLWGRGRRGWQPGAVERVWLPADRAVSAGRSEGFGRAADFEAKAVGVRRCGAMAAARRRGARRPGAAWGARSSER